MSNIQYDSKYDDSSADEEEIETNVGKTSVTTSTNEEVNSIETIAKAQALNFEIASLLNSIELTLLDNSSILVEQISPAAKLFENLNNFKLKYKNDNCLKLNEISNDDLALSFLTHYIAIELLYSPKVNKKYNELKIDHFKGIIDTENRMYQIWVLDKRNSLRNRKTLDNSLFDLSNIETSNFLVEFLSRIRLLIRSDKRRIRNGQVQDNNTCWKICETNIFIETQFSFNDYSTPETKKNENVKANSKRLTYTQYIDELSKIESSFNILIDKRITITQDAIKSLQDDQKNIFMAFWYTIFGVEVSRNPATLIHFNMFLDLIRAEKISWSQIFNYFPMSKSKIVLKAKILNYYFNEFMPHKHKYDFDVSCDDNINILITGEAFITKEWLKFKFNDAKETKDYSTIENIEKIHNIIQESLDDWKLIF
jgi:hypothetical protein